MWMRKSLSSISWMNALDLLDHFFRVLPQNEHNEIAGFTVFAISNRLQNGLATAS